MLNQRQIERLADARSHHRLIERVLANGRCDVRQIQERLLEPRAVAPAALGLALQRLVELTYGNDVPTSNIVPRLLNLQQPSGLFLAPDTTTDSAESDAHKTDPRETEEDVRQAVAATAVVVRGLLAWLEHVPPDSSLAILGRDAAARGLDALAALIHQRRNHPIDVVNLAIVLWQLGDVEHAAQRLELARISYELRHQPSSADDRAVIRHAYASAA